MMGLIENFKKIALVILLFYATDALSQTQKIHTLQVTDGTATETMTTDALIQLDSKNKGMLLPRVALTDAKKPAPLAAHTAGMTVYNTATVSSTATVEGVTPGYYYNNGTKWVRLTTEVEAEWKDGTNLIYAKQAKEAGNDVVITDDGKVGIGIITPTQNLEVSGNVSVGKFTVGIMETGTNVEGSKLLLGGAVDNSDELYIQRYNKGDNISNFRVVAGDDAITNQDAFEVGFLDYTDNRIFKPTFTVYSKSVGIGTTEPKAKLDVNGKVRIADGSQQDGRVLTSDANGVGTWQALSMGNKTTKWMLSGEQLFTKERVELQGNGSFEGADEIGLTISGNQVSLPAGKYIAFIDFDIAGVAEYGQFYLTNTVDKSTIFSTVYGEWLNGATILLRSSNAIKLKADFFATAGPKIQEPYYADPEPSGYTKKFNLKIIFLKLN